MNALKTLLNVLVILLAKIPLEVILVFAVPDTHLTPTVLLVQVCKCSKGI